MDITRPFKEDKHDRKQMRFLGCLLSVAGENEINELLHKHYIPRPIVKPKIVAFTGTWTDRPCGGMVVGNIARFHIEANARPISVSIDNPQLKIDNPPQPQEETVEVKDCDRELHQTAFGRSTIYPVGNLNAIAKFRQQAERGEFL